MAGSRRAARWSTARDRGRGDAPTLDDAALVLRALAHPVRMKIVSLLGGGELCVKRLEEILGIPQPSVSQHLTRLRHAGLISSERRGHLVCYRLTDGPASAIVSAALGGSKRTKGA